MPTSSAGRQIALLALCQALLYINNVTLIAINGLAGLALAPTRAQALNDLAMFVTIITSSAASGALLSSSGWTDLNLIALPPLLIATAAALYAWRARVAAACATA